MKNLSKSALALMAVTAPAVAVVGGTVAQPIESHAAASHVTYYSLNGYFVQKGGFLYFHSSVMGDQMVFHGSGGVNDDYYMYHLAQRHVYVHVNGYGWKTWITPTSIR